MNQVLAGAQGKGGLAKGAKRVHLSRVLSFIHEYQSKPGGTMDRLRRVLSDHRLEINLQMATQSAVRRIAWLKWVKAVFDLAALLGWLLFLGPVWLWWKLEGTRDRRQVAVKSVPYFALTGVTLMVVALSLVSIVVGIVKFQMFAASFGSPKVAAADAFIHYIIHGSNEDIAQLIPLLDKVSGSVRESPWRAAGLLYYIWSAVDTLKHSALLVWARTSMQVAGWIVSLYGPVIAASTAVLAWKIVSPVLREAARYPLHRLQGEDSDSIWAFLKRQIVIIWKEVRASLWTALFVFVFIALSVVAVRALSYPVVVSSIKLVVATVQILAKGGALPKAALVASLLSLVIYFVVASFMFLAPAGILVTKAYRIVRIRLYEHRKYKEFRSFWRAVRLGLVSVTGVTALAAAASFGLYFLLLHWVGSLAVRMWLPALTFAPILFVALYFGSVFSAFKELFWMSVGPESAPTMLPATPDPLLPATPDPLVDRKAPPQ